MLTNTHYSETAVAETCSVCWCGACGQVFVNGSLLGGSEDTLKQLDDGSLKETLRTAGDPLPKDLRVVVDKAEAEFKVGQCFCLASLARKRAEYL